jgi:hypothetical protein
MRVLTPLQRQLLRLVVEEDLSGAEAARRLGLSPGAGRMHLCRMRSRLSERFVGLGGELAVTPFGLLAIFGRRMRALFSASRKTLVAGAPGVLASTLAIATTLGVVHIGIAKQHNGFQSNNAVRISKANARAASFTRGTSDFFAGRSSARTTTIDVTPSTPTVAVPVATSRHLRVARNPMTSGRKVDGGVWVTTPAGTVGAGAILTQDGPVLDPICAQVRAVSCG